MTDTRWFVQEGSKSLGPLSEQEVLRGYFAGQHPPDAPVYTDTLGSWQALQDVFPLAEITPPPVPHTAFAAGSAPESETHKNWAIEPVFAWRRYFARQMDIYVGGLGLFFVIAIPWAALDPVGYNAIFVSDAPPNTFVLGWAIMVLSLLPSALFLGLTGRSLGKLIFGLRVTRSDGRRIGFGKALSREAQVFFRGLALGIPLISLVTTLGAYSTLHSERLTHWDRDLGLVVWYRRPTFLHNLSAAFGITLFLGLVIGLWALGNAKR